MALIRIDRNPPPRQLRIFGMLWLVAFGILGYLTWRRSGLTLPVGALWSMAILVPALGSLYLPLLRWAYLGLTFATYPIGWVISHLVLALVYFAVITPIGIVLRLAGRDAMQRTFDDATPTYWIERNESRDVERYFRQY